MAKHQDVEVKVSASLDLTSTNSPRSGLGVAIMRIPQDIRFGAKGFTLIDERPEEGGWKTAVIRVSK